MEGTRRDKSIRSSCLRVPLRPLYLPDGFERLELFRINRAPPVFADYAVAIPSKNLPPVDLDAHHVVREWHAIARTSSMSIAVWRMFLPALLVIQTRTGVRLSHIPPVSSPGPVIMVLLRSLMAVVPSKVPASIG
ncbi:hypothetical protein SBC1_78660 (plasmid) [Caballeronia sp. SBC1]|nr:hypothetical protein SBC1_78660 [Caballeronia sp. SBC1]